MGFAAFLRQIGVPVERDFNRHGLPSLCEDPNAFLPVRRIWSSWDDVARREDPLLGWHVGRQYGDRLLSQGLLKKLEHAPSLYQALQQFAQLVGAEASHLRLGIYERQDDILFYTYYPDMKDVPGYEISQTYQLEIFIALVRNYLGPDWLPEEIGVEALFVPKALRDHVPNTRIVTGSRFGYLTVPRSSLHIGAPGTHSLDNNPGNDAEPLVRADEFEELYALRVMLKAYLADGYPKASLAASLMDVSVRTLARRLTVSGLTYSALVDQVRFDAAKDLLRDPNLKIAEISVATGFDDPSHFSRMFRRVGGLTPRQFRKVNSGVIPD